MAEIEILINNLFKKLPGCDFCSAVATYRWQWFAQYGYSCDSHYGDNLRLQELDYAKEIREIQKHLGA